ncbi:MAG TPA: rhodanese-like domain-containing protein [Anaerolineae bacterium]|nr:rhodanese-like domain-containing protein [Anaerolineae bacterium]
MWLSLYLKIFMVVMTRIKTFTVLAALTILIAACAPATPAAKPTVAPTIFPTTVTETSSTSSPNGLPQTDADVPRVSVEDAAAAIQSGEAIVVDVRSAQAYQASHIPGALSVPLFDIETDPTSVKLDKDKWIITYCT